MFSFSLLPMLPEEGEQDNRRGNAVVVPSLLTTRNALAFVVPLAVLG